MKTRYFAGAAASLAVVASLAMGWSSAAEDSEVMAIVAEVKETTTRLSPLLVEVDAKKGVLTLVEPGDWTIEERKSRRAEMRIVVKDLDPRKIHYEPHTYPFIVNGQKTMGAIYIACEAGVKCMRLGYIDAETGALFQIKEDAEKTTIDVLDGASVDEMLHFAQMLQRWIQNARQS